MLSAKTNKFNCNRTSLNSARSDSVHESLTTNHNMNKYEFGNFQDTGNWIECESKSYPGRTYFFNLRTYCSTWERPVERNVTLQRFHTRPRVYEKNFTCDLDNTTMIVSSESEEDDHSSKSERSRSPLTKCSSKFRRAREKIFALLYCNANNIGDCLNNDKNNDINELVPDVPKDLRHDWCSETYEISDHFLMNNDHDKIRISKDYLQSISSTPNYIEVKMRSSQGATIMTKQDKPPMNTDDDTSTVKEPIAFFSSSENCESHQIVENPFAPRLPKICHEHLSTNNCQRQKSKQILSNPSSTMPSKPTQIVNEMYGLKTINFDPVERELPPGVKRTNLSDSSVTSSSTEEMLKPSEPNKFEFTNINIGVKNLSSDSSSCSTCSTSTSSDTNESAGSYSSSKKEK